MAREVGLCNGLLLAEHTMLKALDLSQYIFGLGFHFQVCKSVVFIVFDA